MTHPYQINWFCRGCKAEGCVEIWPDSNVPISQHTAVIENKMVHDHALRNGEHNYVCCYPHIVAVPQVERKHK